MKLFLAVVFIALCHIAYGRNYAYFLASGSKSLAPKFDYTVDTNEDDYNNVLSSCWNARYDLYSYQKVIVFSFDPLVTPHSENEILSFLMNQPEGEDKAHRILVERSNNGDAKYSYFIQTLTNDYWMTNLRVVLLEERHRFDNTHPIEHWNLDVVPVTNEIKTAFVLNYPAGTNAPAQIFQLPYTGYESMKEFVKKLVHVWQSRVEFDYDKIIVIQVDRLLIASTELAAKLEEQSKNKQAHIILVEKSAETALSFGSFIEVLRSYQWIRYHPNGNTIHVVHLDTNTNSGFTGNEWIAVEAPGLSAHKTLKPLPKVSYE